MSALTRANAPTSTSPKVEAPEAANGRGGGVGNAAMVERLSSLNTPRHEDLRPAIAELDGSLGTAGGWKDLSATLLAHFAEEEAGDTQAAYADHGQILAQAKRVAAVAPEAAGFVDSLQRHAEDEDRQKP